MTEAAAMGGEAASPRQPRIGIFDDDELSRSLLTHMVELLGYVAFEPGSPDEAIAVSLDDRIDVLLLDINLADHDGITIVQRLRALESSQRRRRFPVIAVTGYVSASDRAACLAAGFDRHIGKPVRFAELRLAIAELLGRDDSNAGPASDADRVAATARRLRQVQTEERLLAPTALENFVMRSAQWIEQMNRALTDGELPQVGIAAQAICDSAKSMGATRLAQLSATLARVAGEQDREAAAQSAALVNAEHAAILSLLLAQPNE